MAEKIFLCTKEGCKIGFQKYAYLRSHFMGKHPGETTPPEEECGVDELPAGYTLRATKADKKPESASNTVTPPALEQQPPGNIPPAPPQTRSTVYRETGDPSGILKSIMASYPGMSEAVVAEVMSWVDVKGTLHPMEVRHLLSQMAGVPKGAPDIISQKYQLAVQKAAMEGDAAIQMTLTSWQYGPQATAENPLTMMPGQMFPVRQPNQTGMPPIQIGGNYPGIQNPNYPGFPYYPYGAPNQPPPQESPQPNPEVEARFGQINEAVGSLASMVENLSKQILETEEQKKEEALNARLEKLEALIIQVANAPRTDENANAAAEAIKEVQLQISAMREEANANKISSLEDKIGSLTDALAQTKDNELISLRAQLEEIKRIASEKTVTGRTEMDVVADLANKALDTVSQAGKDVRAVVMRQATEQAYDPLRTNPADRARRGSEVASLVENEARLQTAEDNFLNQ